MYTNLRPADMDAAMERNLLHRLPRASEAGRRYPLRVVDAITVPREGSGIRGCRLGASYDSEAFVTIPISDILEVGKFTSRRSIVQIGTELRHYSLGTPMGHQESCAKAGSVCLDAELRYDAARGADAARNLSSSYVDDMHVRVLYSTAQTGHSWTRESAEEYARGLTTCFPEPLYME